MSLLSPRSIKEESFFFYYGKFYKKDKEKRPGDLVRAHIKDSKKEIEKQKNDLKGRIR